VSGRLRQRTRCATCAARVQVTPLEIMLRGGKGWKGHWRWWSVRLCPPCQTTLVHQLGDPWIQLELDLEEERQLVGERETYTPAPGRRSRPWPRGRRALPGGPASTVWEANASGPG
jgi:hypothetical protein